MRFEGGIADAVEACGFKRLDMRFNHAEAVRSLPSHHSDPFDRLLIAQGMADAIPGARFEIIEGAGHISSLEQPQRVTAMVESFLASTV